MSDLRDVSLATSVEMDVIALRKKHTKLATVLCRR